ncbi:hypothetical protein Y032_0618g714 [Ancylostoma ceylanicum]|uniref:Uncharacterized protein n=1 Tax=Ancylostoma ceylanicum TaxID=53326 RepID=A0A016WKJ6_9BILA|nr:hypothetical protein Y032_0618g714 [Ancylostoma ceylanicum]
MELTVALDQNDSERLLTVPPRTIDIVVSVCSDDMSARRNRVHNFFPLPLEAVCQVVLGIEMSTDSDSSRRADSNDVLEIRKK